MTVVFLVAHADGILRDADPLLRAAELPSHFRSVIRAEPGQPVAASRDLFTALGFVVLAHEDAGQVTEDLSRIKAYEAQLTIDPSGVGPPAGPV